MDRMQGTSNQQEQTPQGPPRPAQMPTTYAAPRQRTRQELDFDDDGQLTIIDVPILSPRREPAPVEDAPEEDAPEEAAPAEEVELIPEPQQNVAEIAPIAPPPHDQVPYYPQYAEWQYPPQLLNYWYGPQMNQPAYFHQAQGPVVPQYGQPGAEEYYGADGNRPGPSNALPPPPPQNFFGEYGYGYPAQPAHHSDLAPFPVATTPEAYGAPIRPEEPSTPQIQAPTPGQYQDPVQAPDLVEHWEVYVPEGEPVEMEDVDGIEMEEENEVLDMEEELEEEEVMEEKDEELLSSGEETSDGESGNVLELGNFSGIDLDLDLPVNEEQIFQALEDEEEEERKKGEEEEEGEEEDEEEGEVVLVEDEEEEDLETESKKLEQEEEDAEIARKLEDLEKKKAEEEEMNQKLIEQLLSQDMLETRVQTLRKRGRHETNKRKQLTVDKNKAQEELRKKAQGNKMHEFEEGISNDPNASEIEVLLRSMGLHFFQARPEVSRRRSYKSESEDENYDPEESRRPRRKQQVKRRRPNKRQ